MGAVVTEFDVKKDERNRITLKAAAYEYYHAKVFDDGHIEFYPQVLADASVSARTVEMMDQAMGNFAKGHVGSPMDADAMIHLLEDEDDQPG